MPMLMIDTAANLCAACVYDANGAQVLASVTRDIGIGHAEQLIEVVEEALTNAQLSYAQLTGLGAVVGPGSFTGVRVGVSTVRGLAVSLKLPAQGVTTLDGLAYEARQHRPGHPVLAVIDARRGQFYCASFHENGMVMEEPAVLDLEATVARAAKTGLTLTGSGIQTLNDYIPDAVLAGSEATASIVTYAHLVAAKPMSLEKPKPLYLRDADAKPQVGFRLPGREG